jgi:Acetyltransferase (GNAT) domain
VTPDDLANFYRLNGQRVVRTAHAYWYTPSPTAWSIFPYRDYPSVDESDYDQLWRTWRGAAVARTVRAVEPSSEANRALYICAIDGYDLASLSSNTRSKIRRGVAANEIRRVDFDELADKGAALHESTLRRQGRRVPPKAREGWERTCMSASKTGFEGWGAYHEGRMVGLVLGFHFDGRYHLSSIRSDADALKTYPNNALIFTITKAALEQPGVHDVSYGLESVQHGLEGLDAFKLSMGFTRLPVHETVVLRPSLRRFRRPATRAAVALAKRFPHRDGLRKAAGILAPDAAHQPALPELQTAEVG